ncbi:ribosomal protein S12 methylthiotransferase accessory factor [Granulicella aggregans]|uniref:Ribosomal protein S12 methylthiotransferase accessory factor n=1 Tax=Granulicella aggregans TaxID=474949 RepID=A0A7W8E6V7_9BACT|nr:YcaO-like family protein [Granulicella aggregans]MBB5061066.1 ribosomal protein S12 methylthiotransferase accessory factor [Granulicella aggregans]
MNRFGRTASLELEDLVQPWGGLFSSSATHETSAIEPRYAIRVARSGDLGRLWGIDPFNRAVGEQPIVLSGSGVDLSSDATLIPALAEGVERYCATTYSEGQFVQATADELGVAALDLDSIPQCSDTELADPRCPLKRPCKTEQIRWIKGVCLLSGEITYVPAVLAYLYLKPTSPAERLCIQITTGCSAHRTYEQSLLGGLMELVERDAIGLTWLQKLPLPRVEFSEIPDRLVPYWQSYLQASKHLEYLFFDATTDMGVPTVYGLQRSLIDPQLATIVCCASASDPVDAVIKVMRDFASVRRYIRHAHAPPAAFGDFTELSHGAAFMARSEQMHAFDFLTNSGRTVRLDEMKTLPQSDDSSMTLRLLLERVRSKGMHVYAVDLTSDEALRCGLRAVRVIVPELQPFAFHYRARYLGHPRLYGAPRLMGLPSYREEELNHWPQPFA